MKPITSETTRATPVPVRPASTNTEFRPHERWLVRGLLGLGGLIIAAGVWQTIGRDTLQTARRLPVFRRIAPLPEDMTLASRSAGDHTSRPAASALTGLPATSRSFDESSPRGRVSNATTQPGEQPDRAAILKQELGLLIPRFMREVDKAGPK